jgi:hypothetical protein
LDFGIIPACDLSHSIGKFAHLIVVVVLTTELEKRAPMLETIILIVCLIESPSPCKEIHLSVTPEHGASLQLLFYCARHGQMQAQKWLAENSAWRVSIGRAAPMPVSD